MTKVSVKTSDRMGEAGNSLAVQWLGLCASTVGGAGSIPGQGTKIPHATWHGQKINRSLKKKERERGFKMKAISVAV